MPAAAQAVRGFTGSGGQEHLRAFLAEPSPSPAGTGYLYLLSTRDRPRHLKIGFTEADVVERVRQINRATGIVIPFGVRAL